MVAGQQLAWVEKFKYLGSMFHKNGGLGTEISSRIRLAAHAFHLLKPHVFTQQCISMRTRMQIYNSTVLAVLLYGCEAWAPTGQQLQRISVFHHHCLRAMLGVRRADAIPCAELYRSCCTIDAASLVAQRQLRWLGHVGRMSDARIARQALYITGVGEGGRRRRGAPASRLAAHYNKLVLSFLPTARIRELLPADSVARGQRNWLSVCNDRELWRAECARYRAPA